MTRPIRPHKVTIVKQVTYEVVVDARTSEEAEALADTLSEDELSYVDSNVEFVDAEPMDYEDEDTV